MYCNVGVGWGLYQGFMFCYIQWRNIFSCLDPIWVYKFYLFISTKLSSSHKNKKNLPDFALVLYNNLRISFPLHMTNNLFSCMFPCCVAYMTLTSRPPTFEPASELHLRSHIDIDECENHYCESVTFLAMMYPTFITFANVGSRCTSKQLIAKVLKVSLFLLWCILPL